MEMTSFAPEDFLGDQIGVHRKIHTQKLEFFRITQLELRSLERNNQKSTPIILPPLFKN